MYHNFRIIFIVVAVFFYTSHANAYSPELEQAIFNARQSCGGIAAEFNHMKTMAGINTAVTGVGTAAGAGAAVVGFSKESLDAEIEELSLELCGKGYCDAEAIEAMSDESFFEDVLPTMSKIAELLEMQKESKNLGNWRTGLMAGSTATNVAGAVIAGNNKAKNDLHGAVDDCIAATGMLQRQRMQEHMNDNMTDLSYVDNAVSACGQYDTVDLSKIDNRADGAMWSSIVGATLGAAGTVTSAVANTDNVRTDATDQGREKAKNLNRASNVLAVGTSAASATATIFNATQISVIKKASAVAEECEEALGIQ